MSFFSRHFKYSPFNDIDFSFGRRRNYDDFYDFGDYGGRYTPKWTSIRKTPFRPKDIKEKLPPKTYRGKTYDEIKKECLESKSLFEDPDFPAIDSKIFHSQRPPRSFTWLRPKEIADLNGEKALFMVDGASRFDIKQGELGDCWMLAALASLCEYPELMKNVVPEDQSFEEGDYAGIFKFRFWVFGVWQEVIVDDRLPTYNGRLVFLHSSHQNEFWSSLLEKAYAKLVGSYEALKAGYATEAFEDFTGGVAVRYDLGSEAPSNLFDIMLKASSSQAIMSCFVESKNLSMEQKLPNGLMAFHAYSVTGVKIMEMQLYTRTKEIAMVRVRNPWGNEAEWTGKWSDRSDEWNLISEEEKERIGLVFDHDGEFWMTFEDFTSSFTRMEIGYLSIDSIDDNSLGGKSKKMWEMKVLEGSWVRNVSAGGCRNHLETFWTNPQFLFEVTDPDESDSDNTGTVFIALMQKWMRKKGGDLHTIGYAIYKLDNLVKGTLGRSFFAYNRSYDKSEFTNLREVSRRHKLEPGHYVLVPSTFDSGQEADFMIRLFSEKAIPTEEMDEKTELKDPDDVSIFTEKKEKTDEDPMYDALKEAFKKIAGEDLVIDAYELKEILNSVFGKVQEFSFEGFSSETCRSLVANRDADKSGKLEFEEFKKMWEQMLLWKTAFKKHDKDMSGYFSGFELREALKEIGFSVSNQTLNALFQRYSNKKDQIAFDDFILLSSRLNTMFEIFKEMSKGEDKAIFSLDAFIQTTMYT